MERICDVCGKVVTNQPWLLLNRYGVGSGRARCMSQANNGEGDYVWKQGDDGEGEDDMASGRLLCWPQCAATWVEWKMAEADIMVDRE